MLCCWMPKLKYKVHLLFSASSEFSSFFSTDFRFLASRNTRRVFDCQLPPLIISSMDAFEFHGKKYKLAAAHHQYKKAFATCKEAIEEAAAALQDFDTRKGWKIDHSNETTQMFCSDKKNGRHFAGTTILSATPEQAASAVFEDVEGAVKWNDSYKFSRKIVQMSEECDIAHYATNKKLIVEGREFLCARILHKESTGTVMFAAKSIDLKEIKEGEHGIRAHLYITAGRFVPVPNEPKKCTYTYIVCVDMKGMMFKAVLNPILGRLLHEDIENVRRYTEELDKPE